MTEQSLKLKNIENLLKKQTSVILSAVDEKLQRTDAKILTVDKKVEMLDGKVNTLDMRIGKLEIKVDLRFNLLIATLDKFLKRLTDSEDEFEMMKLDINRLKKVIREKLGVDLT